ncbi:hypothetical protein [uncultured Caulobacter sp.]|uniref:hypothetical protein n=1 Tax=uncultured Caulobacter sp. TaxID=158749 RepID=UPI0026110A3A|nr:hypothetical protein [uncultured Caulobacter sp.]
MKPFVVLGIIAALTGARAEAAPLDGKLKAFLQTYVRSASADDSVRVSVAALDLRGDGTSERLVYLQGRDWCGSGGCPLLVLAPAGTSFRLVSKTTVVQPPVRVLSTRTNGWRDLGVTVAGGGVKRAYVARLPFDGAGYAPNPSTPPAVRLKGSPGVVVISARSPRERLFP